MKNDLPTKIAIALLTTGFVLSASSWPILAYGLEDNFKDNNGTYGNAIIQNDQSSNNSSQFLDNNPVKSDSAISFDDDDVNPSEFEKNEITNNGRAIDYPGEVDDNPFINNYPEWGSSAINFQAALYGPDPNFHTS